MLDSVNIEKMGIASLTIVTEPFVAAAKAVAASQGVPDAPLLIVPHDYLEEDEAAVRAKLAPRMDEIVHALFGP